jgi:hypothetical protein
MTKCSACSKRVRTTQRALVLQGPGQMKPGRVCTACARLGWLLVLGGESPVAARKARSPVTAHLYSD